MYRPAISYLQDYLYDVSYDNIDYAYAYDWFRSHTPVISGACSTVRKGNLIGRNLDWTYDESAEFIVHTDGVVGVANAIPGLTDAFVKSGEDSELYKIVPFMLSDGMNKHGLVVSTLVVPTDKGDNSVVHPLVTVSRVMCTLMLPRYILDNFKTAFGAVTYFRDSISLYHPKILQDQHYDQHFVIADENNTYCMEFVEGRYVIKDISSKPYVTNFHLTGVEFNADGSVNTPASGKASDNKITPNGSGLERYNLINSRYKSLRTFEHMDNLMRALSYTRAYQSEPDHAEPRWDTEFVGNGRTVDTPTSGYDAVQQLAAEEYERRERSTGTTWQTVHSVVYDVQDKKLHLYAQENFDTLWEVSVMAEQTHIQRLRGDTAKNDAYTGLNGELTINSQTQVTRLHDGVMKGGYGQAFAAHFDTLPAQTPKDLHVGAIVTVGAGAIEGGVDYIDVVHTKGDETVQGVKTFTASPVIPTVTPATDSSTKAATTAFVQAAIAAGSGSAGAVSLKASKTAATGSWTVTGLDIGKPLYVIIGSATTNDTGMYIRATSGTNDGIATDEGYGIGVFLSAWRSTDVFIVIPTAKSVVFSISRVLGTCTLRAYQ